VIELRVASARSNSSLTSACSRSSLVRQRSLRYGHSLKSAGAIDLSALRQIDRADIRQARGQRNDRANTRRRLKGDRRPARAALLGDDRHIAGACLPGLILAGGSCSAGGGGGRRKARLLWRRPSTNSLTLFARTAARRSFFLPAREHECRLLALSGRSGRSASCPLLRAKRT
jgi:hypothetical protein